MVEIVGVGFMKGSKTYYFSPADKKFKLGDLVIVETARGLELGHILIENRKVSKKELVAELKPVIRKATEKDLKAYRENQEKRYNAMQVCEEKIKNHGLDMKLIDAEYTVDGSKLTFYFSADGRIDFRELVKDLASHFKRRIELRQVGVRDEAKLLGGIGVCGRELCCSKWMSDFQPVSIKMAKTQNLSLNPSKISGACGRLMCCLNFENKTYQELRKGMPNEGDRIKTADGTMKVVNVDLFKGIIVARALEYDPEQKREVMSQESKVYFAKEVTILDKKNKRKGKKDNKPEAEDLADLSEDEIREMEDLISE